jgi:NitT/TauT family transport system substrate-binding protein
MKTYNVVALLVIFSMALAACGSGAASQRPPLKIGWIEWGGFYPLVIGHEKGIFEKHGVNVEPVYYDVYTASFPDLQSGKVDGMLMGLGDVTLNEGRSPGTIRFILVTDISMEAEGIVALPTIASPADLRGKTIACSLGSYGELFVRRMLAANNIGVDEVNLVNMPIESVPGALARGEIQAGHTWEPTMSEAIKQGNHIIYKASDQLGLITDGLGVNTQVVKDRPADLKAFIAAWFETLAWWQANPEEGNQIIAKITGLPVDQVSAAGMKLTGLNENKAAFQQGNNTSSVYFTAGLFRDFYVEDGIVTKAPDVNTMIDPSLLP